MCGQVNCQPVSPCINLVIADSWIFPYFTNVLYQHCVSAIKGYKQNNQPVDGACDFQFSLWDAANSGYQIGSLQTIGNVPRKSQNIYWMSQVARKPVSRH
jgi:hypothetical protein